MSGGVTYERRPFSLFFSNLVLLSTLYLSSSSIHLFRTFGYGKSLSHMPCRLLTRALFQTHFRGLVRYHGLCIDDNSLYG